MHPLLRPVRAVWRVVYRLKPLLSYLVCPLYALEYLVLLLPHLRALRNASVVCPMVFGSFGRQVSEPHLLAMRYKGKRPTIVLDDYRNFNEHILASFHDVADIRYLRHIAPVRLLWRANFGQRQALALTKVLLRFVLRVIGSRAEWVEEFWGVRGKDVEGIYINQMIDLFQSETAIAITPTPEPIRRFASILFERFPETKGKWFVSLYLRKKTSKHCDVRDTDPLAYKATIQRITELGGFVLVGGDYDPHDLFPDCDNVYGYKDFPCDRALSDFYFLTQPVFIVGGHSGPTAIAASFRVPYLVTNNAFFYLSAYHEYDMVLWKKLRDTTTGRVLSASETFSYPIVAFIDNKPFAESGLEHIDNTEEELLAAVNEMLDRHVRNNPRPVEGEYKALYERLLSIAPDDSVLAHSPTMPCYSYLKHLQW